MEEKIEKRILEGESRDIQLINMIHNLEKRIEKLEKLILKS